MNIGLISRGGYWNGACEALGCGWSALPTASAGDRYAADVAARLAAGEQTLPLLQHEAVDFILDDCGAGLTLVKGSGGMTDLKLTHETLEVPLVSHIVDPVYSVFEGLSWEITWQVLASKTWIQAVWDADHANELVRFGAPNCTHLPAAAPDRDYDVSPLPDIPCQVDVLFNGDAGPQPGSRIAVPARDSDGMSLMAAAAYTRCAGARFFDIYHSLYEWAKPPASSDSSDQRVQKATRYFLAKRAYLATLSVQQRDRFVVLLKQRLGDRFHVVGHGWHAACGMASEPTPATAELYFRRFREAAINVNLMDSQTESALNARHFEITAAGGFLLCYDHPEVARHFNVGQECDTFTDEASLLEKIWYYLADPRRRRTIALAGQRRTLGEHLRKHRLDTIMKLAGRMIHKNAQRSDKLGRTPAEAGASSRASDSSAPSGDLIEPEEKLLILVNPGSFTRNYMLDMQAAASRLGIATLALELDEIWARKKTGKQIDCQAFAARLRRERVRAVLSSSHNGLLEWPSVSGPDGRPRPFFECMGIPHLMWWTDHPQWANDRHAQRMDMQPTYRSPNNHYFLKSELAAHEVKGILGWPNCYGLPVAENPDRFKAVSEAVPEFDVTAIVGSPPSLDPALAQFIEQDDPDVEAITEHVSQSVIEQLSALWEKEAPDDLRSQLEAFGRAWTAARAREPLTGSFWLFERLEPEYPEAADWLRASFTTYFDALHVLWEFGQWQRTLVLAYLGRHFRVAVFGSDWSSVGLGGSGRIDHDRQPAAYARGRIAINIPRAGDEEGISHKPFQIAASGVPMLHIDRKGLSDCFAYGSEVATFTTPRSARDAVAALLDDPEHRAAMAFAARERLCREHTWEHRLPQMLSAAGVSFPGVTTPAKMPVEAVSGPASHAPSSAESPIQSGNTHHAGGTGPLPHPPKADGSEAAPSRSRL